MGKGSIKLWAWMVSIMLHIAALTVFGIAKFSHSVVDTQQYATVVTNVSHVQKLIESVQVIPKPKVTKSVASRLMGNENRVLQANSLFTSVNFDRRRCDIVSGEVPVISREQFSVSEKINLPSNVEFFGSYTNDRKICYVVDCSGSMKGVFGSVKRELKESISSLQSDQYFDIIFFGDNKLFEYGNGKLVRASVNAKSAAYNFIDLIKARGQTDALSALEKSIETRDSSGPAASVIYFLTDGFELAATDAQKFPQKVSVLLRKFAPATKINTIGFWPQTDDRRMLEMLARQSGGEFIFVTDSLN